MAHAACEKLNPPGGETAGTAEVTGEEADDLDVTLLPEGDGGWAMGEGLLEAAAEVAASTLTSSSPLFPRMWSMPKLSLGEPALIVGEDIVLSELRFLELLDVRRCPRYKCE